MTDRATANLPARSLDETEAFYAALGFNVAFKDEGWMILQRGSLELEFFPHPELDPKQSWFSACLRVDDLDALYAAFQQSGLPNDCWSTPRLTPPVISPG
jgi:catechol 2,3-dioxygenase-like lactoylglutathione lyase family enzyme